MRYVYLGPYREFRGRVFAHGKPVDIDDKATLDAIKREPDFKVYEEISSPEKSPEPVANACPKCGRELHAKGAHFHIRACKG